MTSKDWPNLLRDTSRDVAFARRQAATVQGELALSAVDIPRSLSAPVAARASLYGAHLGKSRTFLQKWKREVARSYGKRQRQEQAASESI